jgi:quercetin dioxygenase-like cupin family protein
MEILNERNLPKREYEGYTMLDALLKETDMACVKMGKAIMRPGVRVPEAGMNHHEEDEYAYVIKGSLSTGNEAGNRSITAGDFSFIPAGMKHWSQNDSQEDCELIWMMVSK